MIGIPETPTPLALTNIGSGDTPLPKKWRRLKWMVPKYIDPLPLLWFATVVVDTFDTTLVKLSKSWGRKVNYFTA